jgi:hypothetical protein
LTVVVTPVFNPFHAVATAVFKAVVAVDTADFIPFHAVVTLVLMALATVETVVLMPFQAVVTAVLMPLPIVVMPFCIGMIIEFSLVRMDPNKSEKRYEKKIKKMQTIVMIRRT